MKKTYFSTVDSGNSHHFSKFMIACMSFAPLELSILLILFERISNRISKLVGVILLELLGDADSWSKIIPS